MFSSFFTSFSSSWASPLPPPPCSSRSLFTSLIHGDLGRLVADSLSVHDLCQWSRCDRNGRTIVSYKYSHMKYFNLDEVKYTTPHNFARLCTRLRGIEVLHYSVTSPALVNSDSNLPLVPNGDRLKEWYKLINANQHHLRCIRQTEQTAVAAVDGNAIKSEEAISLECILRLHVEPICARLHLMSQLQSLQLAVIEPPMIDALMARINGTISNQKEWINSLPLPSTLEGVATEVSDIPQQQQHVHNDTKPFHNELRVFETFYIHLQQLFQFVQSFPRIEAIQMAFGATSDQALISWIEEAEKEQDQPFHLSSLPSSSSMKIILESGKSRTQPLFSHLLYLLLVDIEPFPHHSVLSFQLPFLLQLVWSSQTTLGLSDIIFDLPALLTLGLHVMVTPSDAHVLQQRITLTGTPVHFALPPSFISSLRRSTKLEYLVFSRTMKEFVLADYSLFSGELTEDEKRGMNEKAKVAGRRSLFAPYTQETRQESCIRMFYYALSVLPCGSTLKMIDESESQRYISLIEYFTLFPSMVTIARTPPWENTISYFGPPDDMESFLFIKKQILHECRKSPKKQSAELSSATSTVPKWDQPNIWQIAHHLTTLPLKAVQVVAQSGRLEHLVYLFLHSIPNVESAALTLLFLECHSLEHASLMQLPGVGNSVFMDLPHDCVRSALRTLRIKTPCGEKLGDATFTGDLLPRLTQLFSHISHFEYLFTLRPHLDVHIARVHSQLSYILAFDQSTARSFSRSLVWPRLNTLTVNQPIGNEQASSLQSALLSRRDLTRSCTDPTSTNTSSILRLRLNLVSTLGTPHTEMDPYWHHALHGGTNSRLLPLMIREDEQGTMKLRVEYGEIPSCYQDMCARHRGVRR